MGKVGKMRKVAKLGKVGKEGNVGKVDNNDKFNWMAFIPGSTWILFILDTRMSVRLII